MKLRQTCGTPFTVVCCKCNQVTRAGDGVGPTFADLDGEPWKAYYCEPCKRALFVEKQLEDANASA